MITALTDRDVSSEKANAMEYRGLSTDSKPTDVPNGSAFIEMNTGDVYLFDADGSSWVKLFSFQG